ncbi:hypothetical protein T439DRAFT_316602 [Meredithblackwellia eburnea MCA 4105]
MPETGSVTALAALDNDDDSHYDDELSYDYVDTINSSLECPICRQPFVKPATSPSCQHTFCTTCILRALELSPTCPIDRTSLAIEDLQQAPRIIGQMVDELKVACPNKSAGCVVECERSLLRSHLRDNCVASSKKAAEGKSGKGKEREVQTEQCELCKEEIVSLSAKAHTNVCGSASTTCLHCGSALTRRELPAHFLQCPSIPIPCPHASHGCPHRLPRSMMVEEHLEVTCAYEPLKDLLKLYDARLESAANENVVLRRRCEALEDGMRDMKDMLDDVRRSMGDSVHAIPSSSPFASVIKEASPTTTVSPPLPTLVNKLTSSVQSLTNSLHSLDAKHSTNLHNESMHLMEEVQSVKGVLHGVRMQMHWVLMELGNRNYPASGLGMAGGMGMGMGDGAAMRPGPSGTSDGGESNSDEEGHLGGLMGASGVGGMVGGRYRYSMSGAGLRGQGPFQMGGMKL